MIDKGKQIKRACGFYADNWHFTMMTLPYLHTIIQEKVITILQSDITKNIEEILLKMNLNKDLKNKILEINWKKTYPIKYSKIEQTIGKINQGQAQNIHIFIKGDKTYIKTVDEMLEKALKKVKIKNPITLVHFYDIAQITNMNEIMKKYKYILNTAGMRKTKELTKKEA